ncbi:hypothetical protein CW613_002296 [Vibrio mimicus]
MTLNKRTLKQRILQEGGGTEGQHTKSDELATALANAIVDEIQANAKALVQSGSSAGSWPIE